MKTCMLLVVTWLVVGGVPGVTPAQDPDSSSLTRAYHQAWFQWAVEGRVAEGHDQLRRLSRRLDLTPPWQMRIGRDLAQCELLLGAELEALSRLTRLQQSAGAGAFQEELQALVVVAREALRPGPEVVAGGDPPASGDRQEADTTNPTPVGDPGPGATNELVTEDRKPTPGLVHVRPPGDAAAEDGRTPVIPEGPAASRMNATDLPRLLATLDRRVERWRESLAEDQKDPRVAGLVGRRHGGTLSEDDRKIYDAATYSFVYATRDNRRLTHNDWDMQFGSTSTRIHVDMVTNDRSQIWDVGLVDFDTVRIARPDFAGVEHLYLQPGHVYLLHIRDWDTDLWVAMQPLELNKHEWVIFRWRLMEMPD